MYIDIRTYVYVQNETKFYVDILKPLKTIRLYQRMAKQNPMKIYIISINTVQSSYFLNGIIYNASHVAIASKQTEGKLFVIVDNISCS